MALLEVLDRHNVPYDKEEVIKRLDIFMKGLRRDPTFQDELKEFNKQKGGKIPIEVKPSEGDYLGPQMRWLVDVLSSPYIHGIIRVIFMVLFFASYLESIPGFGSILSVALDLTIAGSKMLIKTVQKALPPMWGVIPFPLSSLVGMVMAAIFGAMVWPLVAIVSFSRQDFTAAIESFLRVIPPPFGDSIADVFLEANRSVYRMNEKRKQVVEDITAGLEKLIQLMETSKGQIKEIGSQVKDGAKTMIIETRKLVETPLAELEPSLPTKPKGFSFPKLPSLPKGLSSLTKGASEEGQPSMSSLFGKKTGGRKTRNQRFSKKKTKRNKWPKK